LSIVTAMPVYPLSHWMTAVFPLKTGTKGIEELQFLPHRDRFLRAPNFGK
jgi:hypothetical protein